MLRWFPASGDTVVAGRAATQYLQMIDAIDRRPRKCGVAIFANIGRGYVIDRFARCGYAAMAGEASAADAAVLENRRNPRRCAMAIVALIAGWQVRWQFAVSFAAVMATDAGTYRLEVIDPRDSDPGVWAMTGNATIGGSDVRLWLRRRVAAARLAVATGTGPGSTGEHAVRMARLTIRITVGAFESKAGGEMVEGRLGKRLPGSERQQQRGKYGELAQYCDTRPFVGR